MPDGLIDGAVLYMDNNDQVTGSTMTTLGSNNRYNPFYMTTRSEWGPNYYPNNVLWLKTQRMAIGDGQFGAIGGTFSGGNLIVGTGNLNIGNNAGNSFMAGRSNQITINGSTQCSIVLGENSTSGYGNDYMIGYGLYENNNNIGTTYTGKYNKSVTGTTNHTFIVGAGTSNTNRKNAIEVLNDDQIYLGASTTGTTYINGNLIISGNTTVKSVPIVSVTGTTSVDATHLGKIMEADGTFTITLPDGLPIGSKLDIMNVGSGTITIAAATTLQSDGTKLETQFTGCSCYHRGSNVWICVGRLTV